MTSVYFATRIAGNSLERPREFQNEGMRLHICDGGDASWSFVWRGVGGSRVAVWFLVILYDTNLR